MIDTCILIQTCDKYEFLWEGLELSWKLNWNWKRFPFKLFVLTEEKLFPAFSTMKGRIPELGAKNFSTRLSSALKTLQQMGYKKVLYMQDDFWPNATPDSVYIEEILNFLEKDDVDCVHMNAYRSWYNYALADTQYAIYNKNLKKFEANSRFHYNHQACWWKIDSLLAIQALNEEPYENECNGTERSWEQGRNHYFLNYDWYTPELIHHKGTLLPTAYKILEDLRFKHNWELK